MNFRHVVRSIIKGLFWLLLAAMVFAGYKAQDPDVWTLAVLFLLPTVILLGRALIRTRVRTPKAVE